MGSVVTFYSIALPELSLASALGSMSMQAAVPSPPMLLHPNINQALGKLLTIGGEATAEAMSEEWENGIRKADDELRTTMATLADEKATEQALLATLRKHLDETADGVVSPEIVHTVYMRCCGSSSDEVKQIFAPAAIVLLAERRLLSARLHAGVIACCIASNAIAPLKSCIRWMPDLPEHVQIRILKYFISEVSCEVLAQQASTTQGTAQIEAHEKSAKGKKAKKKEKTPPPRNVEAVRDQLIALVFSAAHNHSFLLPCLQELNETEVYRIFRVLHFWLVRHSEMNDKHLKLAAQRRGPSHAQALEWAAAMMDACFAGLVQSPAAIALMTDLRRLVDEQVALCEALHSLEMYKHMDKGSSPVPDVPSYSVELLHL